MLAGIDSRHACGEIEKNVLRRRVQSRGVYSNSQRPQRRSPAIHRRPAGSHWVRLPNQKATQSVGLRQD
jgi:hypothetical protein